MGASHLCSRSLLLLSILATIFFPLAFSDLVPEYFTMKRTDMALNDEGIFVFNGRGQISLRDKTITGVQNLLFPPVQVCAFNFLMMVNQSFSVCLLIRILY